MDEKLKIFALVEQECLWGDLSSALHRAANGYWSIETEGIVQRILWVTEAVGYSDPHYVQIPLLCSGIFSAVLRKGSHDVPDFSWVYDSKWEEYREHPKLWRLTALEIDRMHLDGLKDTFVEQSQNN